jgi:hypothetical protein
MKIKGVSV